MLGNFSFGDYFKERAIELAWELLTKDFGLDKKRLTITVYHEDDEAHAHLEEARPASATTRSSASRPPTTSGRWATPAPAARARRSSTTTATRSRAARRARQDADGDRFIEIWNLVFMQYEQLARGERVDLPKPSIDTGMGLERIAAVLQGTHDNYEIDLFQALIAASVAATGVPATRRATRPRTASSPTTCARRASSSPTACCRPTRAAATCSAASCAAPCATRICSAASDPLMYRLVPALVREMGDAYRSSAAPQPLITETLKLEETRFRRRSSNGLRLLGEAIRQAQARAPRCRATSPSSSTTPSASRSI